ncbi:MAG: hypothetical protein GF307_04135 [candidate division Zixibacteria bacterium]|nr:hypothetical protein [candidate division Zixibacteria bacterium]
MKRKKITITALIVLTLMWASLCLGSIEGQNIFNREKVWISTEKIDKIQYISLADFAPLVNSNLSWDPMNVTATLDTGTRLIKIQLFSSYVMIDNEPYNIIYRAFFKDGTLYVPLDTFLKVCNQALTGELIYYADRGRIDFAPRLFNVLDLDLEERANGHLLTIFTAEKMDYEYILTNEGWLNVTLHGATIDTMLMRQYELKPAVRTVRAYQFENSAQLSFLLKDKNAGFTITYQDNPSRVVISINTDAQGGVMGIPSWRKNDIKLVVVDPGHGGEDPGAVGRVHGTKEKDIVLDISKRLARILEEEGFEVKMTRDRDVFIPLGDRTKYANKVGADLFVSIHANASPKTHPRGNETFFLARAKNDEARAAAALENSALRFEKKADPLLQNLDDLDFILMDIVQNEYLKESQDLADMIQTRFGREIDIPNRGVDQAGFYVLNRAYMPSVLVETAFISNEVEEDLLRNKNFREKVARAIASGIVDFKRKYKLSQK